MNRKCSYCEILNLSDLLNPGAAGRNTKTINQLARYYCNNPHTLNNYCSCKGEKKDCPHILHSAAV